MPRMGDIADLYSDLRKTPTNPGEINNGCVQQI
jgi:hypothetical protein